MAHASAGPLAIDDAIDRIGFGRFQKRLLAVCGVTWAADAAEVFLISFALLGFKEEFQLSTGQAGLVVSATFLGMLLGAWFWGTVSDKIGRRTGFQVTIAIFAVFGLASAFAPSALWLAVLRAMTGFGLGGALPLDFSLFAEYLPRKNRGRWLVLLESFWGVGTLAAAGLAWILVPTLGWRYLLATSAVAALGVLWVRMRVPESPRWLMAKGREEEARAVLNQVAADNGSPQITEPLAPPPPAPEVGPADLLRTRLRGITIVNWTAWFLIAFSYYGIFVWLPTILRDEYDFVSTYAYTFFLVAVQLPGYFSAAWLVERWGRKPTLSVYLGLSAVFTFIWAMVDSTAAVLVAAGLMSFFTLGGFAVLYTYTPETYPTTLRTTGMGSASGWARVGGFIAPYVGGVLIDASLFVALSIFALAFLINATVIALFAHETKGLDLADTLAEEAPEQRRSRFVREPASAQELSGTGVR
jgi:MFS transporter, putative metabolite:H+ symporter